MKLTISLALYSLKVGSYSNDGNSVQILFCPFLCIFLIILCSESVAAEKNARFCLVFAFFFSFVYFLRVGILILKIILSHALKWVISDVVL